MSGDASGRTSGAGEVTIAVATATMVAGTAAKKVTERAVDRVTAEAGSRERRDPYGLSGDELSREIKSKLVTVS